MDTATKEAFLSALIRDKFDSLTDLEQSKACILLAQELGLEELAREMLGDLFTEELAKRLTEEL